LNSAPYTVVGIGRTIEQPHEGQSMSRLTELCFARDPRNCDRAELPTATVILRGCEQVISLPYRWEVCPVCNGRGSHVNPSIDCEGISAEQFADDPDFAEEYFSGTYDVTCNCCGGRTTVPVVDEEKLTHRQRRALNVQTARNAKEAHYERQAYYERMAEIRAGC
jgi:hypothetical protein